MNCRSRSSSFSRAHAAGQGVVAVVVVMGHVHGAVVGVASVGQGGQEAGGQARVAQQALPVGRPVAAGGRQPVAGVQVARQHLEDVVADGAEYAERQLRDAVLAGKTGGPVDDAEQVVLVAVTDARHGQPGICARAVQVGRWARSRESAAWRPYRQRCAAKFLVHAAMVAVPGTRVTPVCTARQTVPAAPSPRPGRPAAGAAWRTALRIAALTQATACAATRSRGAWQVPAARA